MTYVYWNYICSYVGNFLYKNIFHNHDSGSGSWKKKKVKYDDSKEEEEEEVKHNFRYWISSWN